jgi:ubiquinone/menaquinone biosynthesis C-methylase UbiE
LDVLAKRLSPHWDGLHQFVNDQTVMKTQALEQPNVSNKAPSIPALTAIKAKQKATWESGDFGQIARGIEDAAEEFMARQGLQPGQRVLDVACGTGNLAVVAAKNGCNTSGIDIAPNSLAQARARAAEAGLPINFQEADAEALPFPDNSFDLVVSMFGVMFAPQPALATAEMLRVTKPGGHIALANWTLEGFIGEMFRVFKAHVPPPPAGLASPMEWGNDQVVKQRLATAFKEVRLTRRMAVLKYPFPPSETVEFFRKYYGPTLRAFESLPESGQAALRKDLVQLHSAHNRAKTSDTTEIPAEYLEVVATKL